MVRADEAASVVLSGVEDPSTTTDAEPDPDVLRTTSGVNIAASNALGDAPYASARRLPTTEEYSGGADVSESLGGGAGLPGCGWMWTFSSIVIPVIIVLCESGAVRVPARCRRRVRVCLCGVVVVLSRYADDLLPPVSQIRASRKPG